MSLAAADWAIWINGLADEACALDRHVHGQIGLGGRVAGTAPNPLTSIIRMQIFCAAESPPM